MNYPLELEQIRQCAQKRVRQRIVFLYHLAIYSVLNLCLFVSVGIPGLLTHSIGDLFSIAVVPFGWGLFLAIHGLLVYLRTGLGEIMLEREIRKEIPWLGINTSSQSTEKPKRKQGLHLTDDGEPTYEMDSTVDSSRAKGNSIGQ